MSCQAYIPKLAKTQYFGAKNPDDNAGAIGIMYPANHFTVCCSSLCPVHVIGVLVNVFTKKVVHLCLFVCWHDYMK